MPNKHNTQQGYHTDDQRRHIDNEALRRKVALDCTTLSEDYFRIGVTGYWPPILFDFEQAKQYLNESVPIARSQLMARFHTLKPILIVARLQGSGLSMLAYNHAEKFGYRTAGIACTLAKNFPQHAVDYRIYAGAKWDEESDVFLENVDALIRIGGNAQSHVEARKARELGIITLTHDMAPLTAAQVAELKANRQHKPNTNKGERK